MLAIKVLIKELRYTETIGCVRWLQVRVSRSVGMVWWRGTRSVTVAPLTPTPAGRGTPAVHPVIAPSMGLPLAGEDSQEHSC